MDYSGDFDFAMHTAGSSSDAWPYIMDEDALHDSQATGVADRQSVEVDMEETYPDLADNESVEYEMADEEATYRHGGGDLLDVEVYDASQLHSPVPMPATIDTPQMTSDELVDITIPTSVFTDTHDSVHAPPAPQETHLHERSANQLPAVDTIQKLSPYFEAHEEPVVAVASTESYSEHPVDSSADVQVIADHIPHAALVTEATEEVSEFLNGGVTLVENSSHPQNEATESEPTWVNQQDHEDATDPEQIAELGHHESEEVQQYYEYDEITPNVTDPHEISEGVYIDPPPAVLLSLPLSDQPEICLFNQPPTRGGSLSPTEETRQSGQQVLTLLLHHRPTLYYEPLTNVFEALRQEEYLTRIPEFAEGELALDAYDLQLLISEVCYPCLQGVVCWTDFIF
jgi:hypothetical protein